MLNGPRSYFGSSHFGPSHVWFKLDLSVEEWLLRAASVDPQMSHKDDGSGGGGCLDSLRAELAACKAEMDELRQKLAAAERQAGWTTLRVATPLTDPEHTEWEPHDSYDDRRCWHSWCPCCRRPLDVTLFAPRDKEEEVAASSGADRPQRFAYVAALWGSAPGFLLGALVLGQALKRSGVKHELVLLHTEVPENSRTLLTRVWTLKQVEYIDASSSMFGYRKEGCRFEGVFTKLHALSLTEYDKVLMLDLDLSIKDCPDELFELEAPAALRRGPYDHDHGALIDGRRWFAGPRYDWLQCGGINAGVMLLAPDLATYERALADVRADVHPEHTPGGGPEQDYLSRLYVSSWHHISVVWNWQLHQMFHSLDLVLESRTGVAQYRAEPPGHEGWRVHGAIPAHLQSVCRGCVLRCSTLPPRLAELPVFSSADSFDIVGSLRLGSTVVASGLPISSWCPMVPVENPCGFVDGRQFEIVAEDLATAVETETAPHNIDEHEEFHDDTLKDWLPLRLSTDLEEVHIYHFSGEVKMWDRYLEGYMGSHSDFALRLLKGNNEFYARLFITKEGAEDEYGKYGIKVVGNQWEPEHVGATLQTCVELVTTAAVKATEQWASDFSTLLLTLGCTQEELIGNIRGDFPAIECHRE